MRRGVFILRIYLGMFLSSQESHAFLNKNIKRPSVPFD